VAAGECRGLSRCIVVGRDMIALIIIPAAYLTEEVADEGFENDRL